MADDVQQLTNRPASEVLRDTGRASVGVVRILAASAGTPGSEREYEAGDEALVEAGHAEWVVAPVHSPEAGRRLDHDAEREQTPLDGVEVFPPAEPTTPDRRSEARLEGSVDAHSDAGITEQLAARRAELASTAPGAEDGDAKLQAALGGTAARSGPVTAASDLTPETLAGGTADVETAASPTAPAARADESSGGDAARSTPSRSSSSSSDKAR